MNRIMACMIAGGALVCGASAFASDADYGNSSSSNAGASNSAPTMTNSHAVHKKLMKDCMDQQKSQSSSASDTSSKKNCEAQVKEQMQQMNKAGTVPPSSVPQRSGNADSQTTTSGTSEGASSSTSPQQ